MSEKMLLDRNKTDIEYPPGVGVGNREADLRYIWDVLNTPTPRFLRNSLLKEGEGNAEWQRG